MKALAQTVHIEDEGHLQDVLVAKGIGAQGVHDDLKRMLDAGTGVTVIVPGMPPRAIVRKSAIERLTGQPLSGPDLVALPFS
jgi:hypothetical protein